MSKADDYIGELLSGLALLGAWGSGLGLICYQIYNYLQLGFWESFSVIDLLKHAGVVADLAPVANWAVLPTSWVGLHKLISHVPLSLFLIVAGSMLAGLLSPAVEQDSRQQ